MKIWMKTDEYAIEIGEEYFEMINPGETIGLGGSK